MSDGSLDHNIPFLKTTDHSNASKFGNMTLRQDFYELLNIKISNERQREQNAVLE